MAWLIVFYTLMGIGLVLDVYRHQLMVDYWRRQADFWRGEVEVATDVLRRLTADGPCTCERDRPVSAHAEAVDR